VARLVTVIQVVLVGLVVLFAGLLVHVYAGYLRCLRLLDRLAARRRAAAPGAPPEPVTHATTPLPHVTVLVGVHNEAHQIIDRIANVLDQAYPADRLEVVIASDGSTDGIEQLVELRFGGSTPRPVHVVHAAERAGKSAMQNRAIATVTSNVVVFTDADTRFAPGFLTAIVAPFVDDAVGAVQAELLFAGPAADGPPSTAGASQGRYWQTELEIRSREATLGVLAVSSGACIAVRRELWVPLDPAIGEDCMIPLDVVMQGRKVAYAVDAVAHDCADEDLGEVVRTRARMTLRNWQGTWSRPALLNPLRHPGYAFALWSHKVLRWLSPIWLLGLAVSSVALAILGHHPLTAAPAVGVLVFAVAAAAGGLAERRRRRLPICSSLYAFVLANTGFFLGLVYALRGTRITSYR